MENINDQDQKRQTIIINNPPASSNGIGTAGFVLALLALFLGWVPIVGWVLWALGFIFSFCGLFKAPRGLAIAGLIISLIGFALLLVIFVFGVAAIGMMA